MRMPSIGITCYPTQGGSGVVATELGLNLARRGCAVHFISSSLPFRLRQYSENIFYHPVEMPQYPVFQNSPYTLSLATVMSETAVRHGLDILHVHYAIPHAASAYLARQMVGPERLQVVTTLHGTDITLVGQEPTFFPITRFMIEQSDAVTAVSTFLRDETVRVFGVQKPIDVISNFVDARVYRPRSDDTLRRRFAPGGEQVLMHASNFRKVKNLPAVVEVAARVAAARPVRLVLAGDGPEVPAVRELVAAAGIADSTVFLGHVDDLAQVLPAARHAAAAVAARVLRPGGPGGHGLRRGAGGDEPGRGRGFHPGREQRVPARPRGYRGHGRGRAAGAGTIRPCRPRWPRTPSATPPASSASPAS